MAWMFAGTEQDLNVGVHFHQHNMIVPPPVLLVPMTPSFHPSLGPLRDKLAGTVMVDNRKAAKTGTKGKILIPPHLPVIYFAGIGPMMHGMPKENTGVDQILMGAGIGVHPFGGLFFVVIEGKPAAGMLCLSMACMCVGGMDMMLPAIINLLLIPTRKPSVFYGIAPLALDLLVFILAMLENLLDWLIAKIPIPILKDIAKCAEKALLAGVENFFENRFEKDPPMSTADAFKSAARTAGYTFVNGMVNLAAKQMTKLAGDKVGAVMSKSPLGKKVWDATGKKATDFVEKKLVGGMNDGVNALTGGDYNKWKAEEKAKADAGKATAPDPLGQITTPLEKIGVASNKWADSTAKGRKKELDQQKKDQESGKDPKESSRKSGELLSNQEKMDAVKTGAPVVKDIFGF